jgi:protein-disulfide isomerase
VSLRARLALAAVAFALLGAGGTDEMSLGNPAAPVTVVEYASLGCPHCAVWAREVFPEFKRRYVDTGRVRFVMREMLTGDSAVAAAGFLTARCAGPGHYFQVVEDLFAAQARMQRDGDDLPSLLDAAARVGLSRDQVAACLSDHAALTALEARADAYAQHDHVEGTPAFDVAGRRFDGETSLASLAAAIDAAQPRRPRP